MPINDSRLIDNIWAVKEPDEKKADQIQPSLGKELKRKMGKSKPGLDDSLDVGDAVDIPIIAAAPCFSSFSSCMSQIERFHFDIARTIQQCRSGCSFGRCSSVDLIMGVSPESGREKPIDFRAPPPSPVASGRRSCVTNDDVLSEFLESSLRVPDLILPDKIFPKQKFIENPSRVDFDSVGAPGSDSASKMLDSIARVGCFQLVNHGIGCELSHGAKVAADQIFLVPPEKRAAVIRSSEKPYGFEEVHGGEEEESSELAEEFVWCREEGLEAEMQRIWPLGYSNFSDKMVKLQSRVEKIAERVLTVLREKCLDESMRGSDGMKGEGCAGASLGNMCCILKHSKNVLDGDRWASSLRYDVIRMLIRGADYSHALCLHMCDGASEFHLYSKKGWVSFCPDQHSLIITVGDQFQALSGGRYKHVVGRPIVKSEAEDRISMAFLYSPPAHAPASSDEERGGGSTVSVGQQVVLAIVLSLAYHLLVYILNKF